LVLFGTILFATSTVEGTETIGAWVLLGSILIIGLPHGACDFWLLRERIPAGRSYRGFAKVLAFYTILAGIVAGFWFLLPEISMLAFLLLTAWHFGSGDEAWLSRGEMSFIPAASRGLLIVSAPLAFHGNESGKVLNALVRASESSPFVETVLGLSIHVFILAAVVLGIHEIGRSFKIRDFEIQRFAEPLLLGAFFYLVSPLLAVAIYFVAVHSWRHVFRLELYDRPGSVVGERGVLSSFATFYKKALPITALSLVGLVLIFVMFKSNLDYLSQWTSSYLILLSALTVPHAILIRKMEKGLGEPLS
jgi:beta-carotene 15,15'-dioxygenase